MLESANTDLALEWAVERVTHGAFEWARLLRVPHTDVNRFKGDERDSAGNYYSAERLTSPPVSLLRMWIADIYHLLYVLALRKKGKTVLCFGALAEHLFTTGSLQAIPRWLFDWLVCADDDGLLNAHSSATAINNSTMAGAASNAGSMTVHISVKSDDETCDLGQLFAGVTKHIRANERGETEHTTHARNRNKNMLKNVLLHRRAA